MISCCLMLWSVPLLLLAYVIRQLLSKKGNAVKFLWKISLYYLLETTIVALCIPLFALRPRNVKNIRDASHILKHVTRLIGIKWELRGRHNLIEDKGFIIAANHQSTLDALGMFNIWPVMGKCATIARKEVFYILPFGIGAYLGGTIFINRDDPKASYRRLEATSDLMNEDKIKIWMFPEGTRNKRGGILPFRRGAFKMAVVAQVPIVPVVYSPYYFINKEKQLFGSGRIIITALDPIDTKGLADADIPNLMERTHKIMLKKFNEVTEEVLSTLPPDYPLPGELTDHLSSSGAR